MPWTKKPIGHFVLCKLQLDFNLFKRRNSHLIFCGCPLDSLTIGHCPPEFGFYRTFCPGLLKTIRHLGFCIGQCPIFSLIGTPLHPVSLHDIQKLRFSNSFQFYSPRNTHSVFRYLCFRIESQRLRFPHLGIQINPTLPK